jgi:hypothetical protein
MTRDDEIRRLLTRYHEALALAQELALKFLDVVQADTAPVTAEKARASRRFVGEAIARIESGETYASGLWEVLAVERRVARPDAPLASGLPHDRRNPRRSKA